MAQKILINYANEAFRESQKKNTKTGLEIGNFDKAIEYSPKDIDKKFYKKNKHILDEIRGAGYWLWKPYIILKTLKRKDVKHGDFIFYADSGSHFVDKIDHITSLTTKYKQDIIPFTDRDAEIEKTRTKRDAFILMGLDSEKYADTPQNGPGFILMKKSKEAIRFFEEFLKYAQDERIITDKSSALGENYAGFIENRHDQSIFSLLVKKHKMKVFRHPFIDDAKGGQFKDRYPKIVELTRKSSRGFLEKIKYQKACSKNALDFIKRIFQTFLKKIKPKAQK